MAKIAIDCDGVLANFTFAYIEVANKLFPRRFEGSFTESQWTSWNYAVESGRLTKKEDGQVWAKIKSTDNFWLGLDAYVGNVGSLARWLIQQQNQDVYIVTSRSKTTGMTVAKQTDWWLRACGISPVNNYLSVFPVEDSNNKWLVYQSAGIEYSIDDKAETVAQCDFIHPDLYKHKAYLLDRPWNQDAKPARRAKSLDDFLKEIV